MDLLTRCTEISAAITDAIEPLIGTPESGMELYTGADGTPTKKIDEIAENAAIDVLKADGRKILLISEECGEKVIFGDLRSPDVRKSDIDFTVVLDPLDGTFNVVAGIPFYSVSIAIGGSDLSDISLGFIENLHSGDVYYAEAGKGAYCNKKRIGVSGVSEMQKLSVTAYAYRTDSTKVVDLGRIVRRIRVLGCSSLELCYVASGVLDAFVDFRRYLRITDIAAGKLIVEESGGRVTDTTGMPLTGELSIASRVSMLASNGHVHKPLLDLVADDA
ncbi:MAG: bifunctional fructose-bisphosphatase/inositol-phosphate phosphatase [Methanosarcinales archaeon]|nr:bifunctional fructose-bisphosphatase/inositol-phosphate phosphatase [Methanosarcinales archaeon]MCK4811143.1 bifunctional fructose-bisphosphatase/inositol-phosphate phosphatase [Methanosarcinales archaeon]